MPLPTFGQVYNSGVKYIKINRFDSGGLDRSDYIRQLTSLRIPYDDLGSIEYVIATTQEQDNYYILGIQPRTQSTSSINYNIVSQSVAVRRTGSLSVSDELKILGWFGDLGILPGFNTITSGNENVMGGLEPDYTYFTLLRTPNVELSLIVTGSYNLGSPGRLNFYFCQPNDDTGQSGAIYITSSNSLTGAGTLNLKFDYLNNSFTEGYYFLGIDTDGPSGTFSDIRVSLSQSQSPNIGDPVFVSFNPGFLDWDYSDYNALLGNADSPQYSFKYMDVDYIPTSLTPVNFDLIISGTADKAQVQDSNYESSTWSDIRYNGSRYSSFDFNKPLRFVNSLFNIQALINGQAPTQNLNSYIGDYTYNIGYNSGTPCVEQNQTYMAYFEGVGGTGPEIIDQTAYFIKHLIDSQGNVAKPEPNSPALYNLIDNFEPGKKATIKLISNDPLLLSNPNSSDLTGNHKITHVGRITPILVTETGKSDNNYATTMSFGPSSSIVVEAVGEVGARSTLSTSIVSANTVDWTNLPFDTPTYTGSGAWTGDGSPFTAASGSSTANTRVKFIVKLYVQNLFTPLISDDPGYDDTEYGSNDLYIRILKDGSEEIYVSNSIPIDRYTNGYAGGPNILESSYIDFTPGSTFTVQYKAFSNDDHVDFRILGANSDQYDTSINILQEHPTSPAGSTLVDPIFGVNSVKSPYLYIIDQASENYSILVFSTSSYRLYNSGLTQNLPTASADNMNFSPITLPFSSVSPGDYIRFEYNKDQVYCITEVGDYITGGSSTLSMKVTPNIGSYDGLNTGNITENHFVIYRIVNDGTYVVLDVPKTSPGSSFTGIIQPEYISQELKNNYSNIIQDLTSKGLIS
jgi:hypothetical protein